MSLEDCEREKDLSKQDVLNVAKRKAQGNGMQLLCE